jgi:hypothetical protein
MEVKLQWGEELVVNLEDLVAFRLQDQSINGKPVLAVCSTKTKMIQVQENKDSDPKKNELLISTQE